MPLLVQNGLVMLFIPQKLWKAVISQIAKFMGLTLVLSAPDEPHIGPMNLAIWVNYSRISDKRCERGRKVFV